MEMLVGGGGGGGGGGGTMIGVVNEGVMVRERTNGGGTCVCMRRRSTAHYDAPLLVEGVRDLDVEADMFELCSVTDSHAIKESAHCPIFVHLNHQLELAGGRLPDWCVWAAGLRWISVR
jgi:hypothetical protein